MDPDAEIAADDTGPRVLISRSSAFDRSSSTREPACFAGSVMAIAAAGR
jgi:hypothetical protein